MAAAADLATVQTQLSRVCGQTVGRKISITFGSSGMLAAQIRQGAPYDVYLSANERFVKDLSASGHVVAESARIYALGRLGLWSKGGSIRALPDLRDTRILHLAIANPRHAPYGQAAEEALRNQQLWEALKGKLVYGENVRQAYEFAASGNADAVITSWTMVFDKGGILLPDAWHKPIRQAAAIIAASPRRAEAQRFLDCLVSPAGQELLQRNGLYPISTPSDGSGRKPPSTH